MNVSQGYPLWAVESDGAAHLVVGWTEHGYPVLVPQDGHSGGSYVAQSGQVFRYTTTDPSAETAVAELAAYAQSEPDDLRERLHRLADGMERRHPGVPLTSEQTARRIRQELAK